MICTGDKCKARQGPRPAVFHHFCYIKYCTEFLKKQLADKEECNYCMDCRSPHTKPLPLVADRDLTESPPEVLPAAKRVRQAPRK